MMGLQFRVIYKKGINNGAADALSRKPVDSSQLFAMTTVKPVWLEAVEASYVGDPYVQGVIQKLSLSPDDKSKFTYRSGLLRYDNHIWIGNSKNLQDQVILPFTTVPKVATPASLSPVATCSLCLSGQA